MKLDAFIHIQDIANVLGLEWGGDPALQIKGIASLDEAVQGDLSFVSSEKNRSRALASQASVLIIKKEWAQQWGLSGRGLLFSQEPYSDYAQLTQWYKAQAQKKADPPSHHPSAIISSHAHIEEGVDIGPCAVIEAHAHIKKGAQIGAHSYIAQNVCIAEETVVSSRVTIQEGSVIGRRGLIHSGAVIGADGFGFAAFEGKWKKIEQLGRVRIGDDCEIGANTCIDRGALKDTVIGHGVKLDNLIQIAHNVHIGNHVAIAACVGIAGSAMIGDRCTLGGGAIVLGHLELAADVHISAASVVTKSILKPGRYSGVFPLDEHQHWEKNAATLRHLHHLRERIRNLETKGAIS